VPHGERKPRESARQAADPAFNEGNSNKGNSTERIVPEESTEGWRPTSRVCDEAGEVCCNS